MTEQESISVDAPGDSRESVVSETFELRPIGEYLRRQRVLRGMTAEELATITRIPLRSLERLESGQFDGETDGFVRGFVRTVATALGLDAEDTVSRMLREPVPGPREGPLPSRAAKQVFVGIVLVMFLVAGFFVLRSGWSLLLGTASTPASREVVIWHDPVHALAESRGIRLESVGGAAAGDLPSSATD
ncbi:MAG: helix-turn-helix domain-containing protein [Proteobacteria bacterium]|nr:helix-turn-helix domain-containing protein [Pseudomonadota bacterium]